MLRTRLLWPTALLAALLITGVRGSSAQGIWAWGDNGWGQLGHAPGTDSDVTDADATVNPAPTFVNAAPAAPLFANVVAGSDFAAAIDTNGGVWTWGDNTNGELGHVPGSSGDATVSADEIYNPTPTQPTAGFPAGTAITQVAAGGSHTLGLDNNGNVWAWGSNFGGELGHSPGSDGDANPSPGLDGYYNPNPSMVTSFPAGTQISQIGASASVSVALDTNGNVWVWGYNTDFWMGNTDESASGFPTPTKVMGFPAGTVIASVSFPVARGPLLALDTSGNVWAWGDNAYGQLGHKPNTDGDMFVGGFLDTDYANPMPAIVSGLPPVARIVAGVRFCLAVDNDGNLWGWGDNTSGELGHAPNTDGDNTVTAGLFAAYVAWKPVQNTALPAGTSIVAIDAGVNDAVVALSGGGAPDFGPHERPTLRTKWSNERLVGVSATSVWAWGDNISGVLGNTSTSYSHVPLLVSGIAYVSEVSARNYSVYALVSAQTVSGAVSLEGCDNLAQPIDFTFTPATGAPFTATPTLSSTGAFVLYGIPAGTYSLHVKGAKWLAADVTGVVVAGAPVPDVNVTLLPGDDNGDNIVDLQDFNALAASYGLEQGQPGFNANADFNCDGVVDLQDFSLLAADFGLAGDP